MAIVKVGASGKAPKGLKAGDKVVTAGGTYTIQQVNKDGSYKSTKWETGGSRPASTSSGGSSTSPGSSGGGGGGGGGAATSGSPSPAAVTQHAAMIYRPDGTAVQGYNRNGQTFYADGTRVGIGDTVRSMNGKYYTMTADGGVEDSAFAPGGGGIPPALPPLEEPIPTLKPQPNNILGTSNQVLDRYTLEQLLALFQPGVEASYNVQENEAKKMMGVFDQGMFNLGNAGLENVKRGMGTAATGMASKSATGAQALSSILGTYMDAAGTFTGLQQDMQGITDKKAQALEQLVPTAMAAKNTQDSNFANLFNSLYAADTQYGVGALDYLGNKYNADKNLEGVAAQAMANVTASKNSSASSSSGAYNPNSSYDKYVSAMSTAVAEGNRTAFMNAAAGMGYSPKEAEDWWALSNKTDKIATTTGGTTMAERTAALKQMMEENAAKQGKMFVTDPNGVTHFQPRT